MHGAEEEADLLISRLIDDEADERERARFAELAGAHPGLWRQLALRQQDMNALEKQVLHATRRAVGVAPPRRWLLPERMSWTVALSGWAAVVILALTWWAIGLAAGSAQRGRVVTATLTPEQHLDSYLRAPYVLGGARPEVIEVEPLTDGRIAVRFVRRIEEVAFLDPEGELPVDETGELTSDPARLRASEPTVGLRNR